MPKLKLIFILLITTTIILISSIPLSVFAYTEAVYEPGYGAQVSHYTKSDNGSVSLVNSTAAKITKSEISSVSMPRAICDNGNMGNFDYYYVSSMRIFNDPYTMRSAHLIFDYDIEDFSNFNTFEFRVGVFGDNLVSPTEYRLVAYSDGVEIDLPFTFSYRHEWHTHMSVDGVDRPWGLVAITVHLDNVFSYDTVNLKFHVDTLLPAWDTTVNYLFGASDMTAKLMTKDDWVTEIAGSVVDIGNKIDQTNTQLGIIGDTADQIKDDVSTVVDTLTKDLSPEQQQKVDSVIDSINARTEAEDVVIGAVDDVFESFNNIDYDPFDEAFKDSYKDAVEPLWSSPFGDFWNLFWLDPTIMVFVLIALGFSIAGFVLYGVR